MADIEWPDWLQDLRGLRPYIDELQEFAQDPTEYILEIVLTRFVNWILSGTEILISAIQAALSPLVSIPETVAEPLFAGGATIAGALSGIIGTINDTIVTISMAAGPASPLVVVVIWGLIFIAAGELVRRSLQSSVEIIPMVIPWL